MQKETVIISIQKEISLRILKETLTKKNTKKTTSLRILKETVIMKIQKQTVIL